jgi:hypothetical protein
LCNLANFGVGLCVKELNHGHLHKVIDGCGWHTKGHLTRLGKLGMETAKRADFPCAGGRCKTGGLQQFEMALCA